MKKIMYAILAVPVVAALLAGIAIFPTTLTTTAIAASQHPAEINDPALDQEDEGVNEQNDDPNEANDTEESVDPNLAAQAKITAEEAADIAANHLSVERSAVKSIELENEGDLHYSVEVSKDGHTIDVEINAITGTVGTVEQED